MNEVFLLDASGLEIPKTAAGRILSVGEQNRFTEFSSERRRREFLIGRFFLKSALTGFSHSKIKEFPSISPTLEATGKPSLPGFNFNLSHAGEVFILAICNGVVGVDLEPIQDFDDETASFCFSRQQRRKIACSSRPERLATLLWCLREAEGKLAGTGLAHSEGSCGRIHRRGGFITLNGASYAWALASSTILFLKPWTESRSQIQSLLQSFTGCYAPQPGHPQTPLNPTIFRPCALA
jgi:hypothetical protein